VKRGISLRLRLQVAAAFLIVLALAGAGAVLSDLFASHTRDRIVAEMGDHADQLAAVLEARDSKLSLTHGLSDPRFDRPLSGLYWQVSQGGEPLARSRSLWDSVLVSEGGGTSGPGGANLIAATRQVALPGLAEPLLLTVAEEDSRWHEARHAFDRILYLSLGILGLFLAGANYLAVRIGLHPLSQLEDQVLAIQRGLSPRLPLDAPSEIMPLTRQINDLLDKAGERVRRARLQAGNLAHGLKTPLAVISNETAALAENAPEAARHISSAAARIQRTIDHHLARARAAAGLPDGHAPVPIAPVAARMWRTLQKLNPGRPVAFNLAAGFCAVFAGDPEDLDEMLGALMDNGLRWAKSQMGLKAEPADGGRIALFLDDDGPGIPVLHRNEALAAGGRLDERPPGSGLGLAIVAELAELYGGRLALDDAPTGGLRVILTLPGQIPASG